MLNKDKDIFVYGTLKKDHRLHGILDDNNAKYLGEFTTAKDEYDIVDYAYGVFPIVFKKDKGFKIKGQLWSVDRKVYEYIYLMEKGAGYKEETVSLVPSDNTLLHTVEANMFVYVDKPIDEMISDTNVSIEGNTKEWGNFDRPNS